MNSLTVDRLGKCYYIAPDRERAAKARAAKGPRWLPGWFWRKASGAMRRVKPEMREFWALREVSFSVEPGVVLGVIGANGAGKTTLLKVIARVTQPTEGRIEGFGRVVSLLELGAGFDSDATARDNIFMNAAMLGVPRAEVVRRFDRIIEFAEIGEFVDNPLRHYSSGMYLRLAFSVAINMDPDILLADEILAVGDLAFQARCLQRVEEASREGLTVLFVSHDMEAIMRVCNRVLWINQGRIMKYGDPEEVVNEYQEAAWQQADIDLTTEKGRRANRYAEILQVRLVSAQGKEIAGVPIDEDVFVKIRFNLFRNKVTVRCGLDLFTRGIHVCRAVDGEGRRLEEPGIYEALGKIPANLLAESMYVINANVTIIHGGKAFPLVIYNALSFMASGSDKTAGREPSYHGGVVKPLIDWTLTEDTSVARAGTEAAGR